MDFVRFESLIGSDNYSNLKKLRIAIIGIGGVGGYTLESLVRSGIENFLIIDYDTVDITNKNRQIIADDISIGLKKVDVFEKRIKNINKNCNIEKQDVFLDSDNLEIITDYKPDYIIDCCDSIKTKCALISLCIDNNIKFVSSMGTGKRLDASKLMITTLDKTNNDPIARKMRKYCKDNRINKKIHVVTSSEVPKKYDLDFIPSCSYVPSCAGLLITSYVINDFLGNK